MYPKHAMGLMSVYIANFIQINFVSCLTKVIILQEAEIANIFPHGDLLYSALV